VGHMRPLTPALVIYLCAFLACAAITGACGASQRTKTLHATLVAVNTARDGFEVWDLAHQRSLLSSSTTQEDYQARVTAYHERRASVIAAFELAYHALASASVQGDQPSLRSALEQSASLLTLVKTITGGP
jgi:hypothetical protein